MINSINSNLRFASALVVASLGMIAFGQNSLTSRESKLNYEYLYGFAVDIHQDTYSSIKTDLVQMDSDHAAFAGSTAGTYFDIPYGGGVDGQMDSAYRIFGPLNNFTALVVTGNTSIAASHSGSGTGFMASRNPGNYQIFNFTAGSAGSYRLKGHLNWTASGSGGFIGLQRFDGFTWAYEWFSYVLPALGGTFDITGTLTPGLYRISQEVAVSSVDTIPVNTASYGVILKMGTRVTGTVNLQDYIGTPQTVTFDIVKGTSTDTQTSEIDPVTGAFEFYTNLGGSATIKAKGSTWLRQNITTTLGLNCANFNLKNGDCDGMNEVDLTDYTIVVTAFNALPSSGNWDVRADLNGDSTVDLTDYTIVVTNFNSVGDSL